MEPLCHRGRVLLFEKKTRYRRTGLREEDRTVVLNIKKMVEKAGRTETRRRTSLSPRLCYPCQTTRTAVP
jgi:hypothetical protein